MAVRRDERILEILRPIQSDPADVKADIRKVRSRVGDGQIERGLHRVELTDHSR